MTPDQKEWLELVGYLGQLLAFPAGIYAAGELHFYGFRHAWRRVSLAVAAWLGVVGGAIWLIVN